MPGKSHLLRVAIGLGLLGSMLSPLRVSRGASAPPSAAPATSTPTPTPASAPAEAPPQPSVTPPSYVLVDATWDKPIRALPGRGENHRAIVYLHGYCGDVNAPGAFVPAATAHGTLIALLGDQPCKDKPGRFKWSNDIRGLNERILRALKLVNRAQHLALDANDITLFGYSQGALRAESLARFYGQHYPRVILGGPPRRPKPSHFRTAKTIAVFGGEQEDTHDMLGGAEDLIAAGMHARFFLLPGVDHGDFGGEVDGNRSIGEILDFVDPVPAPDLVAQTANGPTTTR